MFHDARRLNDGTAIRANTCIVGAGAAGIALAREFDGQGERIAVLESGGSDFRRRTQRLYIGDNVGMVSHSTYKSRIRMYGGSTTRWAGMCRPLEPIDFERRPSIEHSGWPFSREHLEPYYRRAQDICHLGPYDYDPTTWTVNGRSLLRVDERHLGIRVYQFSHPLDFGKAYADELSASRNIDLYLHANVVEIEVDTDVRRVTGLRVATFEGTRIRLSADRYVLACGGLENPRLLLASNSVAEGGLGNRYDLVGRFFMDHPFFFAGHYEPSTRAPGHRLHVIEDYGEMGSVHRALAALALPERTLREEGMNACAAYFIRRPNHKTLPEYFTTARQSLNQIGDLLRGVDVPDIGLRQLGRNVTRGLGDVSRSLALQAVELARPRGRLALRTTLETTPNPESRVTLGERRDRFAMPRIQVDWRLNPNDRRGLNRLHDVLRTEFERLGLGRIYEDPSLGNAGWPLSMSGGMHHMGTTRMHENPRQGVVDPDCRVHGLANLFVTGSSVFPTGGVANPTLTIVALAVRLADHLKQHGDPGRPT